MAHTPGPWFADDFEIYSDADPANLLAHVYAVDRPDSPDGEWEAGEETCANMRLLKASPLLLADLRVAAETLRRYEVLHRAKNTEDSLAKAEANAALASRFEATIAAATGAA